MPLHERSVPRPGSILRLASVQRRAASLGAIRDEPSGSLLYRTAATVDGWVVTVGSNPGLDGMPLATGLVLVAALCCLSGCVHDSGTGGPVQDRLVYRQVLTSPASTPVHLPAGRYTVLGDQVPANCAQGAFSVFGPSGARVVPLGFGLIQKDLNAGEYTFAIAPSTPVCVWKLE